MAAKVISGKEVAAEIREELKAEVAELKEKHPSVGDVRSIGLFGLLELVKNRTTREPMAPFNGSSPAMVQLGGFLKENGLAAFVHWNNLFTNPPLCINEEQLKETFAVIDAALDITGGPDGGIAGRPSSSRSVPQPLPSIPHGACEWRWVCS